MQRTDRICKTPRWMAGVLVLATAAPLAGCGGEDAPDPDASASNTPPVIQRDTTNPDPADNTANEPVDLDDVRDLINTPDTPETPTPDTPDFAAPVLGDPYRALEQAIVNVEQVIFAEVYFDLGEAGIARAEEDSAQATDELYILIGVEGSSLQTPDGNVVHFASPEAQREILALAGAAFPDAQAVRLDVHQPEPAAEDEAEPEAGDDPDADTDTVEGVVPL